jgi:thioredoxin
MTNNSKIQDVSEEQFMRLAQRGTVLVDFWAAWCGPCRVQSQILHAMEAELPPDVSVLKVNVDEAPGLASEYGVRSIPTLLVLKDGRQVRQFVGTQDARTLLSALNAGG